jgi:nitroreductase
MTPDATLLAILNLARWAPSGDNVQSWQFEVVAPRQVVVHCRDTRADVVYDLHGHPSQISFGALLETIAIAASAHQLRTEVERQGSEPAPVFQVRFVADVAVTPSPLIGAIAQRTVQRRPLSRRPLSDEHKRQMEQAVGAGYMIQWIEGAQRLQAARLMYRNARLRLIMPEAFEVHRSIIDWDNDHSKDKVPAQTLGLDALTLKSMRWAMHSWQRMRAMNRLMGTWAPRLQMDFLPGLACAAHYVIRAERAPQGIDDYVAAGRAVQRFWLTLTQLGLLMQPEMTPLIFSSYLRDGIVFTAQQEIVDGARQLQQALEVLIAGDVRQAVYMGRLGYGAAPQSRSFRKDLTDLLR